MKNIPLSTYRVQFNHLFTFKQAIQLVDYWYDLGITAIYASPLTKARGKSLYGYDVVDHTSINPDMGTENEFFQFAQLLKDKNMGLILDIVPNHMCISDSENFWWKDILESGPRSIYANYFDILWNPAKPELKNKIFLPILSEPLGQAIEAQTLQLLYLENTFVVDYKGTKLPINPNTWAKILRQFDADRLNSLDDDDEDLLEFQSILTTLDCFSTEAIINTEKAIQEHREKSIIKKRLGQLFEKRPFFYTLLQNTLKKLNGISDDAHSFNELEAILKEQSYRLSYWRLSNDLINYRRFFDINELACLHVENQEVFDSIHLLINRLVNEKWITGLRIDHIDGLYDPEKYLQLLRYQNSSSANLYIIVEKILVGKEELNKEWPIEGTSGYDYLNILNSLFIDLQNRNALQTIYENFIGYPNQLKDIICDCKKLVLSFSMGSELTVLAYRLERISEQHRSSYDFSYDHLKTALQDIIASFSVYRSYIQMEDETVSKHDQKVVFRAVEHAKNINPLSNPLVFDFIKDILLLNDPPGLTTDQIRLRREFVMRFQQLTGPVMAKGVEDTALYRSYALSSNNEVGMDPHQFGISLEEFHFINVKRSQEWPHSLSATSTHDTKRSEDVRARINVLSEIPEEWQAALTSWQKLNLDKKIIVGSTGIPDANQEYLFYQILVGSWPASFQNEAEKETYILRIQDYMQKASKEAKIQTSWINPNLDNEHALATFIKKVLNVEQNAQFIHAFELFLKPIKQAGIWNSLAQTILKLTAPGIPDFYQGSEFCELNLVDPDNRRPVDFKRRQEALQSMRKENQESLSSMINKSITHFNENEFKLFLTWRLLNFRKDFPDLFTSGDYLPIKMEGDHTKHLLGFTRTYLDKQCVVIISRFFMPFLKQDLKLDIEALCKNTTADFSSFLSKKWLNVINGEQIEMELTPTFQLRQLFTDIPFVVLLSKDSDD